MSEATDKIRIARTNLVMNQPFFGVLAVRMQLQEVSEDDAIITTAATDGRNMMYNPKFIQSLSQKETIFLVAHEVLHCAFEHFLRQHGRNTDWWNMAADYAINDILKRSNIGSMPKSALYNEKYSGKTAEEIYDLLQKNKEEIKKTLDIHVTISEDGSQGQSSISKDGSSLSDQMTLTPEEAQTIRDEIKSAMIDAYQQCKSSSVSAGNIPLELARMIEAFLEPKITWQQLLTNTIQSKVKSDCSFLRPSKKSWSNNFGAILPGPVPEETIKIGVAIDCSGSISKIELQEFLSEVNGIMQEYSDFQIHLWSFDTKCNAYTVFTKDNGDDLIEWVPMGGGGTNISENWRFLEENELDIETLVVLTDLECNSLKSIDEDFIDTVWVIKNNYNKDMKPPFGRYAKL